MGEVGISAGSVAARMVVGGQLVDAADGRTAEVVDPAHGVTLATVPVGGAEDVDRAVEAAQAALEGPWSRISAAERGRLIARLAATVADHAEELSWLESRNVGKPINGARWEIGAVTRVFDYYAGAPARLTGETIPVAKPGLDLTLREPIGVVGLIVPWNFPLMIAAWKLGPALACGNTCVLKPASLTPLTALRLGELALEAGLPPGVLNVVTGPGDVVGAAIASHPGIGKVAMTGETGDRPGGHATRCRHDQARLARAGRQEPEHLLRRRRHRPLRRGEPDERLRQRRPGLLRAQPDPRRAICPRPRRRGLRSRHEAAGRR